MLKLTPLIDLFFKEDAWEVRAEKIAACGYRCVETWQGGDSAVLKRMNAAGIQLASIVLNFATEAEVAPCCPENRARFVERIDRYADCALSAGCRRGIVTAGQSVAGLSYAAQRAVLVEALAAAGERVASRGFNLNLEALNTEVDHPGYLLNDPFEMVAMAKETGCPNVKGLYDFYHMTIMCGNQTEFLRHNLVWIGHFHIAGVPGRHEPAAGETNYPFLLSELKRLGFEGHLGLEYFPLLESAESLKQTLQYLGAEYV